MNGGVGLARVGLVLDRAHRERHVGEPLGERARACLVDLHDIGAQLPGVGVEVAAGGEPGAVDGCTSVAVSVRGAVGSSCAPSRRPRRAKAPSMSQYDASTNRIRARSRSTTIRVATDCTRPADSRGMTFFHSTGETS